MKQKLLIGTMLCGSLLMMSGSGFVYGQTCTASPSCTELGYTKTQSECGEDGIKCPFGNLWSCKPEPVRASCAVGWIYYADGTCVTPAAHNTSKVALGVVVYVNPDGIGGQVMSAWPVAENGNKSNSNLAMIWGGYGTNITALPDYTSYESAMTDFDSCNNTDKIVKQGGSSTYPAAWAARSYAPTTETKGKWCLPAAGVMTSIYNNQSAVQAGISKLGGVTYPSCCTWSSSESNGNLVLISYFSNSYSYGLVWFGKDSNYYVRPVLEF